MQKHYGGNPFIALGGLSCLLLSACATTGSQTVAAIAEQPVSTPRMAILTAYSAMKDGDERKLLAVCRASRKQRESLSKMTAATIAGNRFRDRFVAAYGQAAWDDFGADHHIADGKMRFTKLNFIDDRRLNALRDIPIDERADEAFCSVPTGAPSDAGQPPAAGAVMRASFEKPAAAQSVRLIKTKGGWLVDGATLALDSGSLKTMDEFAKILRDYSEKIGQPGETPDSLNVEMGAELMRYAFGLPPKMK